MDVGDSKAIASCVKDIPCTQVGDLSLPFVHLFSLQGCGPPALPAQLLAEAPYRGEDTMCSPSPSDGMSEPGSSSQEDTSGWQQKGTKSQSGQAYPVKPGSLQWQRGQGPTLSDTGFKGMTALCLGKAVFPGSHSTDQAGISF